MDVRDACEQCVNVAGGRSLVFVHIVPNFSSLVPHVFCVVVFMVVGMCSYDGTLCGFWWVLVNSDRSFPATRSLRCSVCCASVCFWLFLMERQLARAAHPPCKTWKRHCQRRGVRRLVKRCSEHRRVAAPSVSRTSPSRKCGDTRPASKRYARRCAECCMYHGWTLFGSASFVPSRNRPTRQHATTI